MGPTRLTSEGIQCAIFVMEQEWNVLRWLTEPGIPNGLTPLDVHTVQAGSYKISVLRVSLGVKLDSVPKDLNMSRYEF